MPMVTGIQGSKGRIMPLSRIAAATAGALVMAGLASSAQAQWGPPGYVYVAPPPAFVFRPGFSIGFGFR